VCFIEDALKTSTFLRPLFFEKKNLLQPGCLQPLIKRRIGPTRRQLKHYLVDLQVGSILIFVRDCKQPGLQPGCNNFFSLFFAPGDSSTTHMHR
jgi:hypothetical protein